MRKATIAAIVAAVATLPACSSGAGDVQGPGAQDSTQTTAAATKKILMEVTGPKAADITFGLGTDTSQENAAKLPWKKELSSGEAFLVPTVLAQSKGTGKIACKITVDGKLVKENASTGEFAVVTCTADKLPG